MCCRRRERPHEVQGRREDQEPGCVHGETGREAGARNEHATDCGPHQCRELSGGGGECACRCKTFGADQGRDGRQHGRAAESGEKTGQGGGEIDEPQPRVRQQCVDRQSHRYQGERESGGQHQRASVVAVGQDAADEHSDNQGQGPREADQADVQRGSGQFVHLHRHRDARHQRAEHRAEEPDVQQAKVAAHAERGEIHGETDRTAHEATPNEVR